MTYLGPWETAATVDDGKVVAQPLGAISSMLPTQPLMDRPQLSVTALQSSITNREVTVTATATLTDL